MIKPTKEVLRSIARLQGNELFNTIVKWVKDSKEQAFQAAVYGGEDTTLHQGRAQELDDLVEIIDNAGKTLNNFK